MCTDDIIEKLIFGPNREILTIITFFISSILTIPALVDISKASVAAACLSAIAELFYVFIIYYLQRDAANKEKYSSFIGLFSILLQLIGILIYLGSSFDYAENVCHNTTSLCYYSDIFGRFATVFSQLYLIFLVYPKLVPKYTLDGNLHNYLNILILLIAKCIGIVSSAILVYAYDYTTIYSDNPEIWADSSIFSFSVGSFLIVSVLLTYIIATISNDLCGTRMFGWSVNLYDKWCYHFIRFWTIISIITVVLSIITSWDNRATDETFISAVGSLPLAFCVPFYFIAEFVLLWRNRHGIFKYDEMDANEIDGQPGATTSTGGAVIGADTADTVEDQPLI